VRLLESSAARIRQIHRCHGRPEYEARRPAVGNLRFYVGGPRGGKRRRDRIWNCFHFDLSGGFNLEVEGRPRRRSIYCGQGIRCRDRTHDHSAIDMIAGRVTELEEDRGGGRRRSYFRATQSAANRLTIPPITAGIPYRASNGRLFEWMFESQMARSTTLAVKGASS